VSHPKWCGNNREIRQNEDWCNECEELVSEFYQSECFESHPNQITHRLFIDVPMSWFSTDPSNYFLWLSQQPGEKEPRLFASYGDEDEESAVEIDKSELEELIGHLSFALKGMK
jgi:hypothetical protein